MKVLQGPTLLANTLFVKGVLTKAAKSVEAFFLTSNIPSPGLEYCNVDNCVFKVFACLGVVRMYLQR